MYFTERELQILHAVAKGLTNKEIGQRLSISDLTVRDHVSQMLRKSGARNRVELARRMHASPPGPENVIATRPADERVTTCSR